MELRKKIDYKLFMLCSVISTLITIIFLKNTNEYIGHIAFYLCVLLSFFFLLRAVSFLLVIGIESEKVNMFSMFKLMFFHLIILLIGLGIGVHFMGNKIIIGLINYIIQIFILGLSMKKGLSD